MSHISLVSLDMSECMERIAARQAQNDTFCIFFLRGKMVGRNRELQRDYGLSDAMAKFVRAVAKGGDVVESFKKSGYAKVAPEFAEFHAWQLLQVPAVQAALSAEITKLLLTEDAPAARVTIRSLMLNEKTPASVRMDGAKTLLRLAGFVEPKDAGSKDERPLHELSSEELRSHVANAEKELNKAESLLAERATPVNAPVSPPGLSKTVDPFE